MDSIFNYFRPDGLLLQSLGNWLYKSYAEFETILVYTQIIVSATFPIYISAHASLRCPPSAKLPGKNSLKTGHEAEDDELNNEELSEVQGLQPSDAILFPVLAGFTLGGLYLLIKWLDDPKLLNRILNWYFSGIGIFGVDKLAVDSLNVATTFIFPRVWSTKTDVYFIDPIHSPQSIDSSLKSDQANTYLNSTTKITNPLPGFLSTVKFPHFMTSKLWSFRSLLLNHLILRGYVQNIFDAVYPVRLNDLIGFALGIFTIVLYNVYGRLWWLTNLIAFGFCYGTLQLISPTTFWTGSLVLSGLFIYDIAMVFYTPFMITVARSLDVPIKLVFPGPKNDSMLGLGDIVIPGIMIALALRFDLYLHYLYRQKTSPMAENKMVIKAEYIKATGLWGERFWTSNSDNKSSTIADGARFKKVYFWASISGYIFGLMITLLILNIFKHAQPALLYLVPGVLIPLWGTATVRGEVDLMWQYIEDGRWGFDQAEKSDVSGNCVNSEAKNRIKLESNGCGSGINNSALPVSNPQKKMRNKKDHTQHLILFSLTAPKSHVI